MVAGDKPTFNGYVEGIWRGISTCINRCVDYSCNSDIKGRSGWMTNCYRKKSRVICDCRFWSMLLLQMEVQDRYLLSDRVQGYWSKLVVLDLKRIRQRNVFNESFSFETLFFVSHVQQTQRVKYCVFSFALKLQIKNETLLSPIWCLVCHRQSNFSKVYNSITPLKPLRLICSSKYHNTILFPWQTENKPGPWWSI